MLWLLPLKRYFQFSGRSGRAEYWQFVLFVMLAYLAAGILDFALFGFYGSPTFLWLAMFGLSVPLHSVTFRRLHDRDLSGWLVGTIWLLDGIYFVVDRARLTTRGSLIDAPLALINGVDVLLTLLLAVFLVVQACRPGEPGPNRYGMPPADAATSPPVEELFARATNATRGFPAPPIDPLGQLERLAKLHRDGILTDAEFAEQKASLLNRTGRTGEG